ncbi:helix-turn-helix transcriptional regulator [Staphylococcus cohnii]|uniref:helix-turn-helix domain-containing protein n=2 Tax=Staphylococcus TaxID=1279 RepID=UPI001D009A5A|nr:helix-turn-helix transcriptional regulator [Staphylococcus sp. GDY8P196P]MCQ9293269.1 helix-turn-helix transcriptional regulator [Staphylococcus cohnii]
MKMIAKVDVLKNSIAFKGMNIKDFALYTGFNPYFLNSIINAKRTTSPKTAKKIAQSLDLDIKDVFEIKQKEEVK